jgi:adenosylcobinamide-GDP ribazoletransferase
LDETPVGSFAVGRNGLSLAVTLLTVIPLRGRDEGRVEPPDRAAAAAAMAWAPGVGALLGVVAAGVLVAVDHPLGAGSLTGAAAAVAVLALLTRGLHLDGLADLADGLGSGKPSAAALDIMRKSDIGPLGVVTLLLAVLIQVAALAHAESAGGAVRGAAAVITALVTGRLAMTWACRPGVPAARPGGLGAMVAGTVRPVIPSLETLAVLAAASAAVVIWSGIGWTLPLAVVVALGTALALERHAVRRLGGVTGDVLGALSEVATTVALLVAAMGPRA